MRIIGFVLVMAISFLRPVASFAQGCDALLEHGIRNIQISSSQNSLDSLNYHKYCKRDLDTEDSSFWAQVEVDVIGYGSGGAAASINEKRTKLRSFCTETKKTLTKDGREFARNETISRDALTAWQTCKSYEAQSEVDFNFDISSDAKTAAITLRYTGSATDGIGFGGVSESGFTCDAQVPSPGGSMEPFDAEVPFRLKNEAVNVVCRRDAERREVINGVTYSILPRGDIVLRSASGTPMMLQFSEVFSPSIPDQRAAELANQLNTLEEKLGVETKNRLDDAAAFNKRLDGISAEVKRNADRTAAFVAKLDIETYLVVGGDQPAPKQWEPFANVWVACGGDSAADAWAKKQCGGGTLTDIRKLVDTAGGQCGYAMWRYICVKKPY